MSVPSYKIVQLEFGILSNRATPSCGSTVCFKSAHDKWTATCRSFGSAIASGPVVFKTNPPERCTIGRFIDLGFTTEVAFVPSIKHYMGVQRDATSAKTTNSTVTCDIRFIICSPTIFSHPSIRLNGIALRIITMQNHMKSHPSH